MPAPPTSAGQRKAAGPRPNTRPIGKSATGRSQGRRRSRPTSLRDNAPDQPTEVVIHYPYHPRAGRCLRVFGRKREMNGDYVIVDQLDGTRALLPIWMTLPEAASLLLVELPRLPLESLRGLRAMVDGQLSVLSGSVSGDGSDAKFPGTTASRPITSASQQGRHAPVRTGDNGGGETAAEAAPASVREPEGSR